jgi:hypothetical protein
MPIVLANGGGSKITSSEITAYAAATKAATTAQQTSEEQAVVTSVEEKLVAISASWVDSGGAGGNQRAVSGEVLTRAGELQNDLASTVRQWAKPGRERALMEMFGTLTKHLADRDRLLLELRERLNGSPY